ncbi:MAG: flagellar export chaperone FliS [Pigmentiphaga sp.]|nr:flagellar export chaperone FliS [Pigmentiphaga sp.]
MSYLPKRARGAGSYATIGLETAVNSASPEKLITLLFEGARSAIRRAEQCLARGDIAGRGQAISKALEIVGNGLRASLNLEAGGEVAANLANLYEYIERCLLLANLHADAAKLAEAERLLADLGGAWNDMAQSRQAGATAPTP